MTPEQARTLGHALIEIADQAEAEGRDVLESDLAHFANLDDAARAELAAAIARHSGD